jgi:hypothetical protein
MISDIYKRASDFEKEAHTLLSKHEASKSRIIILEDTYKLVAGLSAKQDDLFRQSLRCLENGLYKSAHVMAWAGLIDFIEEKFGEGYIRLQTQINTFTKPVKIKTSEDLRDNYTDNTIIDLSKAISLISKTEEKALKGLLNKRNECAHPSDFYPGENETLGYVTECIKRLQIIQKKKI